uniref:SWI/SNF complex subunit SWI3C n=1 Tax=Opuntia streptacantha TaxID=393608 RepID=A0A7C9FAQ9_OPUST
MPASSPSDARQKWRKTRGPKTTKRHRTDEDDDDDDEEDNDVVEPDEDEDLHPNPKNQPQQLPPNRVNSETEVLAGAGIRISDFPAAVKHAVNRPHSSVMAIVAAERENKGQSVVLENISHGQVQALSAVPSDNPVLATGSSSAEQEGSVVITPPPVREGRGVVKRFWNRVHVVPVHADWFQPTTVHRLERQVVPHFFSGKSAENTPEKYMDCRNLIVAKYMEDPEKRLSLEDCQGLAVGVDKEDLKRIFRFLDHWGIINYCAPVPRHEHWSIDSYLREDTNGEVHVPSATLKSIDSLIKFDKPKCRLQPHEVYSSLSSNPNDLADLDSTIRERLSESRCNYCSRPLLVVHYQSVKEADTSLCPDCYHEGRFVIGHSSMDFTKLDSTKECGDQDGENWTDQETLLLLEALEIYNDNWNEIADHVGTKSKAQCILHFLRLPMEDGLLEHVEVPTTSCTSNGLHKDDPHRLYPNTNGASPGPHVEDSVSESRFPFANSGNPVMHLVAFLASSLGPRVAAACAHASLGVLSEDDRSEHGNRMDSDDGPAETRNASQQKGPNTVRAEAAPIPPEKVKSAAKAGLAAAAMKAKLFADHEEREIQRLSASIINHQLKRLELKLKQFAEIETLLMKECEQVEKTRQRLAEDRARAIATRFGPGGVASAMNLPSVAPQLVNNNVTNSRPPVMSVPPSQPSVSGYPNNQMGHSQMPFMARQQQMFSFGPRLPLSAIQPTSSGPSSSAVFGPQGSGQPSLSHPMLRTVPGTSSGMG